MFDPPVRTGAHQPASSKTNGANKHCHFRLLWNYEGLLGSNRYPPRVRYNPSFPSQEARMDWIERRRSIRTVSIRRCIRRDGRGEEPAASSHPGTSTGPTPLAAQQNLAALNQVNQAIEREYSWTPASTRRGGGQGGTTLEEFRAVQQNT